MFAEKFSLLIARHPQEADALRRVGEYLVDVEVRHGERVFQIKLGPQRLFDIAQAGSSSRLAHVTSILLNAHIFERRVVVRSPTGGGVEFKSYSEIPDIVRDPIRDVEMEVTAENIEPIYLVVRP
ncbi:hypothetical protein [Aquabacterium sp.]|uniref:hypothetical protein n=1 Tax=Aquabacterium sp. TaxID=1872578 RepID=UPI0027B94125|nr:hypothetical protein [Aquabacterium sp.]